MLIALPYHRKDKDLAINLLKWIGELGPQKNHDLLLVHPRSQTALGMTEPARAIFRRVFEFVTPEDIEGWPQGPNSMWQSLCYEMDAKPEGQRQAWLFLEPDSTLLTKDGFDQIEADYLLHSRTKPFMGDYVRFSDVPEHMSGVAVYPPNVGNYTDKLWQVGASPWDVFLAQDIMRHAHYSPLIQHEPWRDKEATVQPTFPDLETVQKILRPGAVLHHRCKDGSLIERLREKARGSVAVARTVHPSEAAGSTPAPATPVLEARVAELERLVAKIGAAVFQPKSKPVFPVKATNGHKPKRSPEAQAKIDARMASLRARRKARG